MLCGRTGPDPLVTDAGGPHIVDPAILVRRTFERATESPRCRKPFSVLPPTGVTGEVIAPPIDVGRRIVCILNRRGVTVRSRPAASAGCVARTGRTVPGGRTR